VAREKTVEPAVQYGLFLYTHLLSFYQRVILPFIPRLSLFSLTSAVKIVCLVVTFVCLTNSSIFFLEPLGTVTKVEEEGEEEEEEEEEEEREEEEEEERVKRRMSYPGDQMLEDDSLQYRVQGTFSQHR
jgi:signal transduction histidine kinase